MWGPYGDRGREASSSMMVKGGFLEEVFQQSPEGRKNGQSKVLRWEEQGALGKCGKHGEGSEGSPGANRQALWAVLRSLDCYMQGSEWTRPRLGDFISSSSDGCNSGPTALFLKAVVVGCLVLLPSFFQTSTSSLKGASTRRRRQHSHPCVC